MGFSGTIFPVQPKVSDLVVDSDFDIGAFDIKKSTVTIDYFGVRTGDIVFKPVTAPPTGFLLCDGSAVSRTTYAVLFAVIATTFGIGDGSTTFNVPNLKGKVIMGYASDDADYNAIADTGGEKTHALITAELAAHTHTVPVRNASGGAVGYGRTLINSDASTDTSSSAGSGTAHENRPPFLVFGAFIKT